MAVGFELKGSQRARCRLDGAAVTEGGDQHQGQDAQRKPVHLSPDHAAATGVGLFGGRRGKHLFLSPPPPSDIEETRGWPSDQGSPPPFPCNVRS